MTYSHDQSTALQMYTARNTAFCCVFFLAGSAGGLASRGSGSCAVPARRASTRDVFSRGHVSSLTGITAVVSVQIHPSQRSAPRSKQSTTRCLIQPAVTAVPVWRSLVQCGATGLNRLLWFSRWADCKKVSGQTWSTTSTSSSRTHE